MNQLSNPSKGAHSQKFIFPISVTPQHNLRKDQEVIDILPVLDQLDAWRRHHISRSTLNSVYKRVQRVVAEAAGLHYPSCLRDCNPVIPPNAASQTKGMVSPYLALQKIEKRRINVSRNPTVYSGGFLDYEIRIACAIIADAAGYEDRSEWTKALEQDKNTQWYKDLHDPNYHCQW